MYTRRKTPAQMAKITETEGENFGYNCAGPFASLYSRESPGSNALKLFRNTPTCFSSVMGVVTLAENNPEIQEEKINKTLLRLFQETSNRGGCRFWKEQGSIDTGCENIEPKIEEAKKDFMKACAQNKPFGGL